MLNDKINTYLSSLKDKEYNIKNKIEEIKKRKDLIAKIQDKIETLGYAKIPTYKIGIWNNSLTRKEVKFETCGYDTDERIIDAQGDYEYLTDISCDVLIKALVNSKEKYLQEIRDIEEEIEVSMNS